MVLKQIFRSMHRENDFNRSAGSFIEGSIGKKTSTVIHSELLVSCLKQSNQDKSGWLKLKYQLIKKQIKNSNANNELLKCLHNLNLPTKKIANNKMRRILLLECVAPLIEISVMNTKNDFNTKNEFMCCSSMLSWFYRYF